VSRPLEIADKAAELGVRIYSVGIGSRSGEPIQKFDAQGEPAGYQTDEEGKYVMTHLDEETLEALAKRTGGAYVRVDPDAFGLDSVRAHLDQLSRAQRQDTVEIDREEGYAFAVAPALFLLCLALALGDRRRKVPS
jgi:Ca-activated chloride channel family protein